MDKVGNQVIIQPNTQKYHSKIKKKEINLHVLCKILLNKNKQKEMIKQKNI